MATSEVISSALLETKLAILNSFYRYLSNLQIKFITSCPYLELMLLLATLDACCVAVSPIGGLYI